MATKWDDNEEIQIFKEYLQIPSVHPNIDYGEPALADLCSCLHKMIGNSIVFYSPFFCGNWKCAEPCVQFLERQAKKLDLPVTKYYPGGPKYPIVVLTWKGTEAGLPSIVLNSHMDVVPVFEEHWTYPPFSAHIDDDGKIFARGSQDMKCVGVQYLAAIRALKQDGVTPKRTFHVVFVPGRRPERPFLCKSIDLTDLICTFPDEEIGGVFGMKAFAPSDDFKALNVGFSLDEGISSPNATFPVYYAERTIWRKWFTRSLFNRKPLIRFDSVSRRLFQMWRYRRTWLVAAQKYSWREGQLHSEQGYGVPRERGSNAWEQSPADNRRSYHSQFDHAGRWCSEQCRSTATDTRFRLSHSNHDRFEGIWSNGTTALLKLFPLQYLLITIYFSESRSSIAGAWKPAAISKYSMNKKIRTWRQRPPMHRILIGWHLRALLMICEFSCHLTIIFNWLSY